MAKSLESRITILEAIRGARRHRHDPVIRAKPGDDIERLISLARAECARFGCDRDFLVLPAMLTPSEWEDAVRDIW